MSFGRDFILKLSFWASLPLASTPSLAVRTAVFPAEIHNRTAIWLDQNRIFSAEQGADAQRPIWIHAGDSIATAWSDGPSLTQKLQRAEGEELPDPRSVEDYLEHLPDASETWYAGSNIGYGILGRLDHLTPMPWVIISTALAGATAYVKPETDPKDVEDPLLYIPQVEPPERVRLITFSLGTNDVCDGVTPFQNGTAFQARVRAVRAKFPKATIVPFKVARVTALHKMIMDRLSSLPNTIGKTRLTDYCQKMWEQVCPQATVLNSNIEAESERIEAMYQQELKTDLFDSLASLQGVDILDVISSDCFHPSAQTEAKLQDPLSKFIQTRLNQ